MKLNQYLVYRTRAISYDQHSTTLREGMLFQCDRHYEFEDVPDIKNSVFYFIIQPDSDNIQVVRFTLDFRNGYEINNHFFESDMRNMTLVTDKDFIWDTLNKLKDKMSDYFDVTSHAMFNTISQETTNE